MIIGLKKLRNITQYKPKEKSVNKNQGVAMALDYLQFIPDFRDTWEVQRWGFLEETSLYGDIFNPLLILETLKNFNASTKIPFMRILKKASLKIPPDTDDLGLILQLAGDFPKAETHRFLEVPLKLLLNNLDPTGFCPTWLSDENQYTREYIKAHWFGDECIAVMANLYYGLACYDKQAYQKEIERGTAYILAAYQPEFLGWKSTHYKSRLYNLYLVSRLLRIQNTFFNFATVLEQLLQNQCLNGSWDNSPQETAFALLFLKSLSNQDVQLKDSILKAEIFLLDTQMYDGSWDSEDLFIRPGKNAVYEYFKHPKITTAFCLRALI